MMGPKQEFSNKIGRPCLGYALHCLNVLRSLQSR